jgi:hypothetical protein
LCVRFAYELAIVQGSYGLVLTQWDKREAEGENMIAAAREKLEEMRIISSRREKAHRVGPSGSEDLHQFLFTAIHFQF